MSLLAEARLTLGELRIEIEIAVPAGRCLAIAGPSGAGKSTILQVIAGLRAPAEGRVRCREEVWLDTDRGVDLPPERRRCGVVFQDHALFPHRTALQNVADALRDRPRSQRANEAAEWLQRVGLTDRADARPASLSGGERQRVALARALARRPKVLLLDEPLSALDTCTRGDALQLLGEVIAGSSVPVVLVTHDFLEAAVLGDEVAVVDAGRIVQQGAASELAARPASAFVADLTGAIVIHGIARGAGEGMTAVRLPDGQEIHSTDPGSGPVVATVFPWEVALRAEGSAQGASERNQLAVDVRSVTELGGRVRVGLGGPAELAAEISSAALAELRLQRGDRVVAVWKATATRLLAA